MTAAGKHIVDEFGALPDAEKREVLANILQIARNLDNPELGDDEHVANADSLFVQYDRAEADE